MAETPVYDIPYPTNSSPVDVAGDLQAIAERIEVILPTIGLPYHTLEVVNNSGVSIAKGDPVYISGFGTSKPRITKSQASTIATFPVIGLAQSAIGNGSDGVVVISGVFTDINTSSYAAGDRLYVGSSGVILVGSFKGNGTWGSMKAGLA
jgi:hypothetical protein